jgi:hypothetical protein
MPETNEARDFLAWGDEDGNCWMRGHVDPVEFVADVRRMEAYCLGDPGVDHDASYFNADRIHPDDVDHLWYLPDDPDDEETMYTRCEAGTPGAEPYTVWWCE